MMDIALLLAFFASAFFLGVFLQRSETLASTLPFVWLGLFYATEGSAGATLPFRFPYDLIVISLLSFSLGLAVSWLARRFASRIA
jgi:hypothetical protein